MFRMLVHFAMAHLDLYLIVLTVCVMLGCIMMGWAAHYAMLLNLHVLSVFPLLYVYNVSITSHWSKASVNAYPNFIS